MAAAARGPAPGDRLRRSRPCAPPARALARAGAGSPGCRLRSGSCRERERSRDRLRSEGGEGFLQRPVLLLDLVHELGGAFELAVLGALLEGAAQLGELRGAERRA